jgi:hypothetical protein
MLSRDFDALVAEGGCAMLVDLVKGMAQKAFVPEVAGASCMRSSCGCSRRGPGACSRPRWRYCGCCAARGRSARLSASFWAASGAPVSMTHLLRVLSDDAATQALVSLAALDLYQTCGDAAQASACAAPFLPALAAATLGQLRRMGRAAPPRVAALAGGLGGLPEADVAFRRLLLGKVPEVWAAAAVGLHEATETQTQTQTVCVDGRRVLRVRAPAAAGAQRGPPRSPVRGLPGADPPDGLPPVVQGRVPRGRAPEVVFMGDSHRVQN